jgi:hypothetical protein
VPASIIYFLKNVNPCQPASQENVGFPPGPARSDPSTESCVNAPIPDQPSGLRLSPIGGFLLEALVGRSRALRGMDVAVTHRPASVVINLQFDPNNPFEGLGDRGSSRVRHTRQKLFVVRRMKRNAQEELS